ncbi:hypothetical protein [Cohnella sp. 56]|uniref:hypothetical protein n=1 Tax=Cohnella sp. 56 TaxID=3113722 RepID=UPI0030EA7591
MPRIPEEPFRPSKEQVVVDLLKSVALEETAIAHLLHAEADKWKAMIAASASGTECRREQILERSGEQAVKLLDVVIMKEWLLLRKMEAAMDFYRQNRVRGADPCDNDEE